MTSFHDFPYDRLQTINKKNTGKCKKGDFWSILQLLLRLFLSPLGVSINKVQASKTRMFALFQTFKSLTISSSQTFPGGKIH